MISSILNQDSIVTLLPIYLISWKKRLTICNESIYF